MATTNAMDGAIASVVEGGTGLATLTANNVILGNGTSNVGFVSPSTSGNVLTSNGTTWTSAAAGGGGAWAVVSTASASNSAQIDFTGMASGFDYMVVMTNFLPASDGDCPYIRFGTGGTPTYDTSSHYVTVGAYSRTAIGIGTTNNAQSTAFAISNSAGWKNVAGDGGGALEFMILNPSDGTRFKSAIYNSVGPLSVSTSSNEVGGCTYASTTAVTAVRTYCPNGNITSGDFVLLKRARS